MTREDKLFIAKLVKTIVENEFNKFETTVLNEIRKVGPIGPTDDVSSYMNLIGESTKQKPLTKSVNIDSQNKALAEIFSTLEPLPQSSY